MKAEKLYPIVSKWEEQWKRDCGGVLSSGVATEFALVKEALEKEMRDAAAKQGGVKSVYNAANAIIKNAKKCYPYKLNIHGMYEDKNQYGETIYNQDGDPIYCVCDGYTAVRFKRNLPLERVPDGAGEPFYLENIVKKPDGAQQIVLPDLADIKVFCKTCNKDELYCLDEELDVYVNPVYLANIMGCLPNATVYARDGVSAIYFEAENSDGVLMPARPNK